MSELSMYKFHYDYVLKTFDNVKLLFTDTESLIYEIKGGNVYEQCIKDKHFLIVVDIVKILFIMMIQIKSVGWVKRKIKLMVLKLMNLLV